MHRSLEPYIEAGSALVTVEVISTATGLADLVERLLGEPSVALDTESNSFHRYPEQVCLVQIAVPSGAYVVDPLPIDDMSPLGRLLADRRVEKVLHAADNDIRGFDREWGFAVVNVYDTSIAARFVGMQRSGLDTVLQEGLGIRIQKSKGLQRADWSLRPLTDEALAYAVDDVAHLLPLREELGRRLEALGRTEWVAEECARLEEVRYAQPDPPEVAFLSMRGSRHLDGRGLAVLRELMVLREAEARRRRLPPFRVLSNNVLLHLAGNPDAELSDVLELGVAARSRLGPRLREALRRGLEAPPVVRPPSPFAQEARPTRAQMQRLRRLKQWRTEHGERLGLDAALVWPMASLERLAREPESLEEELTTAVHANGVRRWQRAEFEGSLRERLVAL